MDFTHHELDGLGYTVRFPAHFDEEKRHPVILFLHGAGTRWTGFGTLENNTISQYANAHEDFPFVLVMPLCNAETWFDLWEPLKKLVKQLQETSWVDEDRFYLSGNSMGGYGTWQLGMCIPKAFAAIVPVCGGGMYWEAYRLKAVPVWAFHGALDQTVLPEESQKMVDAVNKRGGNAKLTIYPNNTHDAWTDTYSNPEVYAWLLQHRKEELL